MPVVTTGTCAWMREMHASFWCRCSQRKREAGTTIDPVWNQRDWGSSAVKLSGVMQVRFLRDPPIARQAYRADAGRLVSGRAERKSLVGLHLESEAGRVLHAVANRWVPSCGMAFEWSTLRQFK